MASPGALRAALSGCEGRARYAETARFDPESFVAAGSTASSPTTHEDRLLART